MRLKKLIVTRHRSVKDQESLVVDDRVTILIGANDHGKSNILAAVQCLNDRNKIDTEDKNWDAEDGKSVEIVWQFAVTEDDLLKLRKSISESPQEPAAGTSPEFIPIKNNNEIVYSRDSVTNKVKVDFVPIEVPKSLEKVVLDLRPRVELFASPDGNLKDQVNLTELASKEFEFMQGIFRLAGLWDERESIFTQNDRTSKILDQASGVLTKILNDKWNQGKELNWKFKHTGTNGDHILITIEDPAIKGRYSRPSLRSSGFRTYFLLSMIISARTQNNDTNTYLYLFDEPGTYLHPHAQLDLQRSFETIADRAQIIYTTHSLFLVSKNHPERNRVVSKTKAGTKIDQKPFTKNWKAVRQSLGIILSNNFLIADKTLLVEGPSDIVFLLDAVRALKKKESIDIDLNDFSVVDAGDAQNYIAMAKLMLSEGREVVALLDGDTSGKNAQTQLKKCCEAELKAKKLKILLLPDNKSSEDVFTNIDTLRLAVRRAYDALIQTTERASKQGLDIESAVQQIASKPDTTLGKVVDDVTKGWFEQEEKISKLLISVLYEDIRENSDGALPEDALTQLQKIKDLLGLRGEKSVETGVFEEVD